MKPSKSILFLSLILIFSFFLRLFKIDEIPSSLYTDEISQGYNAYSIMSTGRDEYGTLLPVSLRSFGDWKPPLPAYLMIPFMGLFGLNELSVRLPSVILGTASILVIYYFSLYLFINFPNSRQLALLNAFLIAISPWHILQSRSAMLVIIGFFFLIMAVFMFLKGAEKRIYYYISATSFALSVYSYYGFRVIAPLFLVFLIFYRRQSIFQNKKAVIYSALLGFFLLVPLLAAFMKEQDVIFGRARTVSVFYDQGVNLRKWELITQDGLYANPLVTRFFHNNFYMYGKNVAQRFLSHLDFNYLLMKGDNSPPFQLPNMGIMYYWDAVFIIIGITMIYRKKFIWRNLVSFWIVITILPAALTFVTPSSNRTFNAIFAYTFCASVGIIVVKKYLKLKIIYSLIVCLVYLVSFGYFLKQYFIRLPIDHADWWNYGWKDTVKYISETESKYNSIIISSENGMPYIYFLFYKKYSPGQFQKNAVRTFVADRFGYEHVEGFGKYIFQNDFDWKFTRQNNLLTKTLYVVPISEAPDDTDFIKAIYYPNGTIAFKLFAYE